MDKPFIDLILLCYGKFRLSTKPCLDSLLADWDEHGLRLTVIDNGSTDDSVAELKQYLRAYPHVRTVYLEKNLGYAGGMNHGASVTNADWLFLISNDTIFLPGTLSIIRNTLVDLPRDVGLVGPISNAAGNEQGYSIEGKLDSILQQGMLLQHTPSHVLSSAYRLDFFCVAIRRSVWEKLGGFDPVFGKGYYEDTDFSMRAKKQGYLMKVCEDAFVYHQGGGTLRSDPDTKALIRRNKKIFLERHPDASLFHQRECNLRVLEEYMELKERGVWNDGLELRAKLRIDALRRNLPRSFLKRMIWKSKIKPVLQYFAK